MSRSGTIRTYALCRNLNRRTRLESSLSPHCRRLTVLDWISRLNVGFSEPRSASLIRISKGNFVRIPDIASKKPNSCLGSQAVVHRGHVIGRLNTNEQTFRGMRPDDYLVQSPFETRP